MNLHSFHYIYYSPLYLPYLSVFISVTVGAHMISFLHHQFAK